MADIGCFVHHLDDLDMTVQELIDELQKFNKDATVKFQIDVSCNVFYVFEDGLDDVLCRIDEDTQELSVDVDFEEEADLNGIEYNAKDDEVVIQLRFDGTV